MSPFGKAPKVSYNLLSGGKKPSKFQGIHKILLVSFLCNIILGGICFYIGYLGINQEGQVRKYKQQVSACTWADRCCYLAQSNFDYCSTNDIPWEENTLHSKEILTRGLLKYIEGGSCSWKSSFGPYHRDLIKDGYNYITSYPADNGKYGWLMNKIFSNYARTLYISYDNRQNIPRDLWQKKLKDNNFYPKHGIEFTDLIITKKFFLRLDDEIKDKKPTLVFLSYFFKTMEEEILHYVNFHGGREMWVLLSGFASLEKKLKLPKQLETFPTFQIPVGSQYDYLYLTYFENRYHPQSVRRQIPPTNCRNALRGDTRLNLDSHCVRDRSANFLNMDLEEAKRLPITKVRYDPLQFLRVFSVAEWNVPATFLKYQATLALSQFCNEHLLEVITERLATITNAMSKAFLGINSKTIQMALLGDRPFHHLYSKVATNIYRSKAFTDLPVYILFLKNALTLCQKMYNKGELGQFPLSQQYTDFKPPNLKCLPCSAPINLGNSSAIVYKLTCQNSLDRNCPCVVAEGDSYESFEDIFAPNSSRILITQLGLNPDKWVQLLQKGVYQIIGNTEKMDSGVFICELERKMVEATERSPLVLDPLLSNILDSVFNITTCLYTHCPWPYVTNSSIDWNLRCGPIHIRDSLNTKRSNCSCIALQGSLNDLTELVGVKRPLKGLEIIYRNTRHGILTIKNAHNQFIKCFPEKICRGCTKAELVEEKSNSYSGLTCAEKHFSSYQQCPCTILENLTPQYIIKSLTSPSRRSRNQFYQLLFEQMGQMGKSLYDLIEPYKFTRSPFQVNFVGNNQTILFKHIPTSREFRCQMHYKRKKIDSSCHYKVLRLCSVLWKCSHALVCKSDICGHIPIYYGAYKELQDKLLDISHSNSKLNELAHVFDPQLVKNNQVQCKIMLLIPAPRYQLRLQSLTANHNNANNT